MKKRRITSRPRMLVARASPLHVSPTARTKQKQAVLRAASCDLAIGDSTNYQRAMTMVGWENGTGKRSGET